MTETAPTPPFSRPIPIRSLPEGGLEKTIEATGPEGEALARACGLAAVKSLKARFDVSPKGTSVRVRGTVSGLVTLTCSVSLEPFDDTIEEEVDLTFMPQASVEAWLAAHHPRPNDDLAFDDDPPDAIVDGKIDLGAIAAEFLALGVPPYPRKPGVTFEPAQEGDKEPSPFAALARLKNGE